MNQRHRELFLSESKRAEEALLGSQGRWPWAHGGGGQEPAGGTCRKGRWWALCTPLGVPASLPAASLLGSEHTVLSCFLSWWHLMAKGEWYVQLLPRGSANPSSEDGSSPVVLRLPRATVGLVSWVNIFLPTKLVLVWVAPFITAVNSLDC